MRAIAERSSTIPIHSRRLERSCWVTFTRCERLIRRTVAPIRFFLGLSEVFFKVCACHTLTLDYFEADMCGCSTFNWATNHLLIGNNRCVTYECETASYLESPSSEIIPYPI